jgi:hypothetical protein
MEKDRKDGAPDCHWHSEISVGVDGFTTRVKHDVLIECHPSPHDDKTGIAAIQIRMQRVSAPQNFL